MKRRLLTRNTDVQLGGYRLVIHPSFDATIGEMKEKKISLPDEALPIDLEFSGNENLQGEKILEIIGRLGKNSLDAAAGQAQSDEILISAYDESLENFKGLEGTGYLTAHSLVIHGLDDYIPINLLTFYFYTRSLSLSANSVNIRQSEDPESDSKRDYLIDRSDFLLNNVPDNSLLFVDGPLIGGNMSKQTMDLNNDLVKKKIIPIFFIKNSTSNLVTYYVEELKGKYNSDMHWAYSFLKAGERTNFFRYIDQSDEAKVERGKAFSKVFCYLKAFNVSPVRIEIESNTFEKYRTSVDRWLDLVYYLLIVQGDLKNPQVRTIAIAEKYARATLNLINLGQLMKELGITPTMNQERFAW